MEYAVRPLPPQHNAAALALWETTVRATHDFVAERHIVQYRELVREALQARALDFYGLYAVEQPDLLLAFMAVEAEEAMLGMLFVAVGHRGRGHGTRLVRHALELGVRKVDVNEQNAEARAFYERRGFVACGGTPLDGVGNPYPLVHMKLG